MQWKLTNAEQQLYDKVTLQAYKIDDLDINPKKWALFDRSTEDPDFQAAVQKAAEEVKRLQALAEPGPMDNMLAPVVRDGVMHMHLYGNIAEDKGVGPMDFVKTFSAAGGMDSVLHINSDGGSVPAGLANHELIKQYPGKIKAVVEGRCMSAATFAALACNGGTEIQDGAEYQAHNCHGIVGGDRHVFQQAMERAIAIDKRQRSIYAQATGKSDAEIEAIMDKGQVLTARQAIDMGFCKPLASPSAGQFQSRFEAAGDDEDLLRRLQAQQRLFTSSL